MLYVVLVVYVQYTSNILSPVLKSTDTSSIRPIYVQYTSIILSPVLKSTDTSNIRPVYVQYTSSILSPVLESTNPPSAGDGTAVSHGVRSGQDLPC